MEWCLQDSLIEKIKLNKKNDLGFGFSSMYSEELLCVGLLHNLSAKKAEHCSNCGVEYLLGSP